MLDAMSRTNTWSQFHFACGGGAKRRCLPWLVLLAVGLAAAGPTASTGTGGAPAPELVGNAWLNLTNGDRLSLASRKGKVTVVHFWTFDCINCKHNLPFIFSGAGALRPGVSRSSAFIRRRPPPNPTRPMWRKRSGNWASPTRCSWTRTAPTGIGGNSGIGLRSGWSISLLPPIPVGAVQVPGARRAIPFLTPFRHIPPGQDSRRMNADGLETPGRKARATKIKGEIVLAVDGRVQENAQPSPCPSRSCSRDLSPFVRFGRTLPTSSRGGRAAQAVGPAAARPTASRTSRAGSAAWDRPASEVKLTPRVSPTHSIQHTRSAQPGATKTGHYRRLLSQRCFGF